MGYDFLCIASKDFGGCQQYCFKNTSFINREILGFRKKRYRVVRSANENKKSISSVPVCVSSSGAFFLSYSSIKTFVGMCV